MDALNANRVARGDNDWTSKMSNLHSQNGRRIAIAVGLLLITAGCKGTDNAPKDADAYSSFVSDSGDIKFPSNFPTGFVFIGSWAVSGTAGVSEIHAVYARPTDVSNYQETGKFLDGAVLVKEVSNTLGSPHTTGNAFWANDTKTWFMMIKDSKQRFPLNPLWGDGWGWAEFNPATKKQISTNYKTDCQTCHIPVSQSDWVYAYAYPILGPKAQAIRPKNAVTGHQAEAMVEHSAEVIAKVAGNGVDSGKAAFGKNCAACHSVTVGGTGIGPSLAAVVGRKAGALPGYEYSPAMSKSKIIWTPENIAKHIEKPKELIPGNRMANLFPRGVQDAKQRADIVAYLETVK